MPKKNSTPVVDNTTDETVVLAGEQMSAEQAADIVLEASDVTLTEEEITALADAELVGEPEAPVQADTGTEPVQEPVGQSDDEPAEGDEDDAPTYAQLIEAITEEERTETVAEVEDAFNARDAFEASKGGHYDSISKSLEKSSKKLRTYAAAEVLIACQVDPYFVNRGATATSGYNVYAIDKVADIVATLAGAPMKNAINRAIILSLFSFRDAEIDFTGEHAKAAASNGIRVSDAKVRALLTRHIVAPSTAPTQASSTMSALQTLGIVSNTGTQKAPTYRLTDAPQTRRLEEVMLKAA